MGVNGTTCMLMLNVIITFIPTLSKMELGSPPRSWISWLPQDIPIMSGGGRPLNVSKALQVKAGNVFLRFLFCHFHIPLLSNRSHQDCVIPRWAVVIRARTSRFADVDFYFEFEDSIIQWVGHVPIPDG